MAVFIKVTTPCTLFLRNNKGLREPSGCLEELYLTGLTITTISLCAKRLAWVHLNKHYAPLIPFNLACLKNSRFKLGISLCKQWLHETRGWSEMFRKKEKSVDEKITSHSQCFIVFPFLKEEEKINWSKVYSLLIDKAG